MKINSLLKVTAFTLVSCLTTELLAVSPSQAQRFTNGCNGPFAYFYQHANLGGQSTAVCEGINSANLKDQCLRKNWRGKCLENMNDSISSVSAQTTATLYSDTNFRGNCITIPWNLNRVVNLSQVGFDDVTSSVKQGADARCRVIK